MVKISFRFEGKKAKQVVSQVMVIYTLRRCFSKLRLKEGEVHVSFISDLAIQKLNRQFRKKNMPTDVLSFPTGEGKKFPGVGTKDLGDVFISWHDVSRRAKIKVDRFRLSAFLAVHGALHLLGFDHHTTSSRAAMRKLENHACGKHTFYE